MEKGANLLTASWYMQKYTHVIRPRGQLILSGFFGGGGHAPPPPSTRSWSRRAVMPHAPAPSQLTTDINIGQP